MAKPVVIVVGADKGGVGKTTVSRTLLDYFSANKHALHPPSKNSLGCVKASSGETGATFLAFARGFLPGADPDGPGM